MQEFEIKITKVENGYVVFVSVNQRTFVFNTLAEAQAKVIALLANPYAG